MSGKIINVYQWQGEQVFLAGDISTLLGYSRRSALANKIRKSAELVEGHHFHRLDADELKAFKGHVGAVSASVALKHAHSGIIVITERGLSRVCTLAKTPAGKRFRGWLADAIEGICRAAGRGVAEVQA